MPNVLVFFLSIIFFSSATVEMCKVEKDIILLNLKKKEDSLSFLPSMIRNSVLQSFVYPGCLLTCMVFLDSSYLSLCFKLYYICFIFVFRSFPIVQLVLCLSGIPRKHTGDSFSDWSIFEPAISNNYTWLLAFASTLIGLNSMFFYFPDEFQHSSVFARIASCLHHLPFSWDKNTC